MTSKKLYVKLFTRSFYSQHCMVKIDKFILQSLVFSVSSYKTLKLWEIHNSVFMNVSIIVKFVKILFCE